MGDPDGVDIVCFGGEDEVEWYRNIKNTKGLEEMVASKRPNGPCLMGSAMNEVLEHAFDSGEKDMTKRPVSVLVLTAGRPDDSDELDASLLKAVTRIGDTCEACPLSVTFVQIGNDKKAEEYLKHLDGHITATSAANGEMFDLVDTIKDDEIQAAMSEIKGTKSSGKNGALIGAFAGAAMGVGGMYIYNKQQAKKRTAGWGGKWKVTYDGEEQDEDAGYVITFKDPAGDWDVEGTVEDEHAITWSDGTRWDEIPQGNGHWTSYAAAGAGAAAAGGATGFLLDKKFFNKAKKGDQCDYIIMMDRSAKMARV